MRRGRGTWYSGSTTTATPCRGSRGATPNTGPRRLTRGQQAGNPLRVVHSPASKRCEVAQVAQKKREFQEGDTRSAGTLSPGHPGRRMQARGEIGTGKSDRDAASGVARRGAWCPSSTVPRPAMSRSIRRKRRCQGFGGRRGVGPEDAGGIEVQGRHRQSSLLFHERLIGMEGGWMGVLRRTPVPIVMTTACTGISTSRHWAGPPLIRRSATLVTIGR